MRRRNFREWLLWGACVAGISLSCCVLPVMATDVESQNVADEVDRIYSAVTSSSDYTVEEICYVLENDEETGAELLKYLDSIALPAECDGTEADLGRTAKEDETRSYSVEYNAETGEEKIVYDDFSDEESEVSLLKQDGAWTLALAPRSYADWTEENPQSWADTKTIFKLYIWPQDYANVFEGTGFRISKNYIATAGHCIYCSDYKGWAGKILCVPAYRVSDPTNPLGSSAVVVSNMTVGGRWRTAEDIDEDWGVLQLKTPMTTGYIARRCVDDIKGESARIAGYPLGTEPLTLSWGTVTKSDDKTALANYTRCGGQSGAPVTDSNGYVIGIHRGSYGLVNKKGQFVKLDTYLFNKLNTYN